MEICRCSPRLSRRNLRGQWTWNLTSDSNMQHAVAAALKISDTLRWYSLRMLIK